MILIKWFHYKKNSFEVSNFMWILTIALNSLSSATRACISVQNSNEFCELVAHFPERSETFMVKAVFQTVKLLACITGAL